MTESPGVLDSTGPALPRRGWDRLGDPFSHALDGNPVRWAFVVAGGALLAGLAFLQPGHAGTFEALAWAAVLAVTPLLAVVDFNLQILPNRILYPVGLLVAGVLGLSAVTGETSWSSLASGPLVAASVMGVVTYALWFFLPVGMFGLGDVRLFTLVALVAATTHSLLGVFLSLALIPSLTGLVAAVARRPADADEPAGVPFGPFILLSFAVMAFWPELILESML